MAKASREGPGGSHGRKARRGRRAGNNSTDYGLASCCRGVRSISCGLLCRVLCRSTPLPNPASVGRFPLQFVSFSPSGGAGGNDGGYNYHPLYVTILTASNLQHGYSSGVDVNVTSLRSISRREKEKRTRKGRKKMSTIALESFLLPSEPSIKLAVEQSDSQHQMQ